MSRPQDVYNGGGVWVHMKSRGWGRYVRGGRLPAQSIYSISAVGVSYRRCFGGGALLFLESIIKLWHICRTNIKINKPLQIISRHYTQHLYSFDQRSDNQCINVNYTDMLWISSLNINKIKHFERILARWVQLKTRVLTLEYYGV